MQADEYTPCLLPVWLSGFCVNPFAMGWPTGPTVHGLQEDSKKMMVGGFVCHPNDWGTQGWLPSP